MHFQPSRHSYGASETTIDIATVSGKTAIAGGGAAATVMVAAGSAAAVPVAGWVVAGGLALTAGGLALRDALKGAKTRQAEALKIARKLKIRDPNRDLPYIVKIMRMERKERRDELKSLRKKLREQRKDGKRWFESKENQRKDIEKLRWRIAALINLMRGIGEIVPAKKGAKGRAGKRRGAAKAMGFGRDASRAVQARRAIAAAYASRPVGVSMPPTRPVGVSMPQSRTLQVMPEGEIEAIEKVDEAVAEQSAAEEKAGGIPTWGWVAIVGVGVAVLYFSQKGDGTKKGKAD
jgi:hypothetical protein